MSTLLYARMRSAPTPTGARALTVAPRKGAAEDRAAGTTTTTTGMDKYIAAVAALVPAEVLAAHALLISFSTSTDGHKRVVNITHPGTLALLFWLLLALTEFLYLGGRGWKLKDRSDYIRAAIPGASFVIWTMLQRATAFDGVVRNLSDGTRFTIGVVAAIALAFIAAKLGPPAAD